MNYNLDEIRRARTLGVNSTLTIIFTLSAYHATLLEELKIVARASGGTFYKKGNVIKMRNIPDHPVVMNVIECLINSLYDDMNGKGKKFFDDTYSIEND